MASERDLHLGDLLFEGEVRRLPSGPVFDQLPSWRGRLVLDHGCGDAPLKREVIGRGGMHVGLDPYGATADLAAPGEAIPLRDASVDVVLSKGVLHLVPHPTRDFAEIARVLRPGGTLHAYVAFTESFQESSTMHFSHRGIEQLCRDAGLILESIRPTARGLDYHAQETFLPMGMGGPLRTVLRAVVRAISRAATACWAAAFAARRCLRDGQWSEWTARSERWRWYFDLALASGFDFVARKPGEWTARETLPATDEMLRDPVSLEPLRREASSEPGVDAWLVGASRARAFPVKGTQRLLRERDAKPAARR